MVPLFVGLGLIYSDPGLHVDEKGDALDLDAFYAPHSARKLSWKLFVLAKMITLPTKRMDGSKYKGTGTFAHPSTVIFLPQNAAPL